MSSHGLPFESSVEVFQEVGLDRQAGLGGSWWDLRVKRGQRHLLRRWRKGKRLRWATAVAVHSRMGHFLQGALLP